MNALVHSRLPAPDWEHGLVLGDGSLGAVLHGGDGTHRITFSHEEVVLPADPPRPAPDLAADLPLIRSWVAGGRAQDAAALAVSRAREEGYPGLQWTDPIVPVAELEVVHHRSEDEDRDDYRRTLDLDDGVATVSWGGGDVAVRAFVSRADRVCVAEVRGPLDSVELKPARDVATSTSGVRGGNGGRVRGHREEVAGDVVQHLDLIAPWDHPPRGAATRLRRLAGRDGSTLYVLAVRPRPGVPEIAEDLPGDWDALLDRHRAAATGRPAVTHLDLGAPGSGASTEELLSDPDSTAELLALQYRAAQHTIGASTGRYPPTLQGIWSGTFDPAWSSDFTMNGNVQCGSVAGMLGTGNPAQLRTHLDLLERLAPDFADNARRLFGAGGYLLPSRCSITHGLTTHFDQRHCHEFWTAGGAWAAAAFLDHCWYTGDLDHLAGHGYPFAREVERFYESFLLEEEGRLVFSPSYSPENRSPSYGSQACRNATMDRAALHLLLTGLLRAGELIGVDSGLQQRRRDWLARLPPYRVAPDGTLAEWLDDGVEERLGHRTASQLLGLWFEPERELVDPGPLREAVRELVRAKLTWRASPEGVEEMGYGLVQLGLAAAAIGDAEAAATCVQRMSRQYFLPSLSTTHDVGAIFNVDVSGGLPAVVNAMLLGSTTTRLRLLPALPTEWPTGRLVGVHVRGALVVEELSWSPDSVDLLVRALPGARRLRGGRDLEVAGCGLDLGSGPERPHRVPLADGDTVRLTATRRGR